MRDRDPVHRMRLVDGWVLTCCEHVDTMPRDHGRYANEDRRFHDTRPWRHWARARPELGITEIHCENRKY